MTRELPDHGTGAGRRFRADESGLERRSVSRRRVVGLAGGALALSLAGCLGRDPGRGTVTMDLDSSTDDPDASSRDYGTSTVTPTGGDGVEVLVARLVIRDDADGPRASYRLRNDGGADATVALRTVLRVDGGGTYEATAHADVPVGDAVVVAYRIATWHDLGAADAERVRRHDARFDVYVNGDHRRGK